MHYKYHIFRDHFDPVEGQVLPRENNHDNLIFINILQTVMYLISMRLCKAVGLVRGRRLLPGHRVGGSNQAETF